MYLMAQRLFKQTWYTRYMPWTDPVKRQEHYRAKYANDPEYREHVRTYRNDWRRTHRSMPAMVRERERNRDFFWRLRAIATAIKLDSGCVDCGYNTYPEALDFDHIGDDKLCDVSKCHNETQLLAEIAKCEVVCANCHRRRTALRR